MPFKKGETPKGAKPFVKGQIGNPEGRPKKIYTILKKTGFSKDDIRTAFQEMSFYNLKQLKAVGTDENMPAIVILVAQAYREAIKTSDYSRVKEIIKQIIGNPIQELDVQIEEELNIIRPERKKPERKNK